jgi:hypothetical protein
VTPLDCLDEKAAARHGLYCTPLDDAVPMYHTYPLGTKGLSDLE